MKQNSPEALPPFDKEKGCVNVIIETPKGSRNKFKWDTKHELYSLSNVLPTGAYFPYDFGFIPSTVAEDGDPIDVLLFMDEPAFSGCHVAARLIGVIRAEEAEGKRNDRLVAVAHECQVHRDLHNLNDLSKQMLDELEQFFVSYHRARGEEFKILDHKGPKHALELVKDAEKRAQGKR